MDERQQALVARARQVAETLYRGEQVAHRSCGVAVAETFGLAVRPYTVLRRGGLTGEGRCGAILAGELVLAELLGSDDPAAPLPAGLAEAIGEYRRLCDERIDRHGAADSICNDLLAPFADFASPARKAHCTSLAAQVAELVAELAVKHGVEPTVATVPGG